jgi:Fe-S oxidoreductase
MKATMATSRVEKTLYQEITQFGARDMEICMQCGNCSASCPLSTGEDTFPRTVYRYLQLGLRDKLLSSPVPWLCYYCGECNKDCPRGAEPAETMMAARRWLTTQYDWTGLAKRLYLSEAWEIGALALVALFVVLLFVFFHGPIVTDRVSVNTFAPVMWIEIGDLAMAFILSAFLFSNAFRMFRFIMAGTRVPFTLYLTEARSFVLHFATQKKWRECSSDRSRWLKHFILVTGYMTMMTLIIVFIRWFQVDDSSWHFTSIFGYYATGVLLFLTVEMFLSRLKKKEDIHRFSEPTDWLFLVLLFFTTLTGILMHVVRLAGWPMGTYVMYVIHLAIAVPMLVIEVPFGKWSHLFYRPLAAYLSIVKEKARVPSFVDIEKVTAEAGSFFMECMQCGTCTSVCPLNWLDGYSPRWILRQLGLNTGTREELDTAVWACLTCNACGSICPRNIDIVDITRAVRRRNVEGNYTPERFELPLHSLNHNGNPWSGLPEKRTAWASDLSIPDYTPEHEYCLFTCCTTAYDAAFSDRSAAAAGALPRLLNLAGVGFGTLGLEEACCGDPARSMGDRGLSDGLRDRNTRLFLCRGVKKLVTTSPHCLETFRNHYPELDSRVDCEHYTELLDRLLAKGRLKTLGQLDIRVTFHDPCYLGRYNGIFDAPRRVLAAVPGLELVEMEDCREASLCCGGGGGGAWGTRPADKGVGAIRVEQALATGAKIIATACPYCARMLAEAIRLMKADDRIIVRDLAALLMEAALPELKTTPVEYPRQEVMHA